MANFSVLQSGSWKTVKDYYVKQSNSWKKIKKAYVKQSGTWKLYYTTPVVITITENSITNSENGTVINNPEDFRLDYYDANSVNTAAKKIWYNLDLLTILNQLSLNSSTLTDRELIINLNNVYIGGRHGKLTNNGTNFLVDCSLRRDYAFKIQNIPSFFSNVTLKATGTCKIQGFGGFAMERWYGINTHGSVFTPFTTINEGPATGWPYGGNATPYKDMFGVDFTYIGNDTGWAAYTDTTRVYAMQSASKHIDIKNYYPSFNPSDVSNWNSYKTFIADVNVIQDVIPFSYNTNEFPSMYFKTDGATAQARQGKPGWHGGNALLIDRQITITTDAGSVLNIQAGAGGGMGYPNGNRVTYGSGGGRGLPGGRGAMAGYVHKHDGRDESNDWDEQARPGASLAGEYDAPLYNNNWLQYGRYIVDNSQSNLNQRFYQLFGVANTYSGICPDTTSRDFYNDSTANQICLVGNLSDTMRDRAFNLNVSTPGLAINYNGQTINTSGANVNILGPELLNGDGLSFGNWKR